MAAEAVVSPIMPVINNQHERSPASKGCRVFLITMPFSLETLAAVATILGTVISILALLQSRAWIVLTSLLFVELAIAAGLYARRERVARQAASTVIEGYSIDSLNIANLRRRLDRDLEVFGLLPVRRTSTFEFSIDSGAGTSFHEMDCVAYELGHDPEMAREIRPLLLGPEGVSKKFSAPDLEPLKANQPFGVLLKCTLPRCLTAGTGYYINPVICSGPGKEKHCPSDLR